MKFSKIAGAVTLIAFASSAFAQTATTAAGTGTAQAGAQGGAAVLESNSGPVDYSANSAIAPGLVAGLGTCMGSSSVGGSGKIISIAFGTTWKDEDCLALNNGRELWNQGFRAASIGVLCSRDVIRYAISVTGGIPYTRQDGVVVHRPCPMTADEWEKAGKPFLNPITGQPFSDAELNPPVKSQPIAAVPAAPTSQQLEAAKAALIAAHAADIEQQQIKTALDENVAKSNVLEKKMRLPKTTLNASLKPTSTVEPYALPQ